MKHGSAKIIHLLRLIALATTFTLSVSPAQADDYTDVNLLVRAGKLSEAQAKADQYLAAKPRDPQMRFIKGVIQRESGKTSDAIATFTKLTEDYPELPEPYNNLAVLYASQNQFDKARASLEMAIRTNPSYSTAHENLGDVYAKLASQAYNKALQLDGSNAGVQPKLSLIRELFNPSAKGQRPSSSLPAPATAPATSPAPATVAQAKPQAPVPAAPVTAPAAKPAPQAAAPAAPQKPVTADAANKEVEAAVRAWAKAWAGKDMNGYLGAYGKDFDPPGNQSRSVWEDERRKRIKGKNSISVKLENLSVSVNGNKAVAKFRQDYKADALSVSSRKTLELLKTGERWQIIKESTGT